MGVGVVSRATSTDKLDVVVVEGGWGGGFDIEGEGVVVCGETKVRQWDGEGVPGGGGEVACDVVFEINDGDDLIGLVGEV